MSHRYILQMENADGSLDAPFLSVASKREALRAARLAARYTSAAAVWIYNAHTGLSVQRIARAVTP